MRTDTEFPGTVLDESSPSAGDRFKYAGMELDAATGLDYDRARWYDPSSGRFINSDPLGLAAGDANTLRYAKKNNPSNMFDKFGLFGETFYPGWYINYLNNPPSDGSIQEKIRRIADKTEIWDFAPESCERWVFAFEKNLRNFSDPRVKEHGIGWEPSNAIGGGHAVYNFTFE